MTNLCQTTISAAKFTVQTTMKVKTDLLSLPENEITYIGEYDIPVIRNNDIVFILDEYNTSSKTGEAYLLMD